MSLETLIRRCSVKRVCLKISQNSQENTCGRVSFFNKVAGLRPAILLKKRLRHWCFPVNFAKFLRTPFYRRTPLVAAASVSLKLNIWIWYSNKTLAPKQLKDTVMQTENKLINYRLHFSKVVSWKFRISYFAKSIYNFPVIYPWNLLFLKK